MARLLPVLSVLAALFPLHQVWAEEPPQEVRHELMEVVKEAAEPVGAMLKGEQEFDPWVVMESFEIWSRAAGTFGDLFPEGTETGYDTEARETIWSDREGFNEKLNTFATAVQTAIDANPQSLEEMERVAGPIFKACKACHEDYRVEHEH